LIHLSILRPTWLKFNPHKMEECFNNLVEPENKLTSFGVSKMLTFVYHRGSSSISMLQENLRSFLVALILNQKYPITDELNDMIFNLMSGGFFRHWEKNYNQYPDEKKKDKFGPQALAMDELQIAFKVCLFLFIMSVAAFLLEFYFKQAEVIPLIVAVKDLVIRKFKALQAIKVSTPKPNLKRMKAKICLKLSKICKIRKVMRIFLKKRQAKKNNLKQSTK
jgi:hypothetical protein